MSFSIIDCESIFCANKIDILISIQLTDVHLFLTSYLSRFPDIGFIGKEFGILELLYTRHYGAAKDIYSCHCKPLAGTVNQLIA